MARGSESKAARKAARKEARAKEAERILEGETGPSFNNVGPPIESDSSSSEEEDDVSAATPETEEVAPKKKKKSKSARAKKAAAARTATRGGGGGDMCCPQPSSSGEGIKTLPLVMLVMLTGTTLIPAFLYAGDWFTAFIAKNHIMGNLGHRLGIGPSPKKRVISFYEKHDPEKVLEVPNILSKYYGDYPKLVKRLERKYGDYGYFLNWEQDEAPMTLAFEKLWETKEVIDTQFNKHAPAIVKTGVRNMRHNFGFVYKKGMKVWKKQVWPVLQPYLGTPSSADVRKQKLKDKKDYEKRKKEQTGQRRKSAEFRDEDDEM